MDYEEIGVGNPGWFPDANTELVSGVTDAAWNSWCFRAENIPRRCQGSERRRKVEAAVVKDITYGSDTSGGDTGHTQMPLNHTTLSCEREQHGHLFREIGFLRN